MCYIKNADEVGLPQAIDPSASENSKIYNEEVRNTVVKNGPKNPMSTIKLPIGFPCSVSDLIIKSRKDKFRKQTKPTQSLKIVCYSVFFTKFAAWKITLLPK